MDFEDFVEDFKTTKVIGILKQFVNGKKFKEEQIKSAIEIVKRKLALIIGEMPFEVNIEGKKHENKTNKEKIKTITDIEWEILGDDDKVFKDNFDKMHKQNKIGISIDQKERSQSVNPQIKRPINYKGKKDKSQIKKAKFVCNNDNNCIHEEDSLIKYFPIIKSILNILEKKMPNYEMNGDKNLWIVKPSGLSRGRGIKCINKLSEILHLLKSSNQYIIQKYIENPLIILGRKFDIRQWVLVTDFSPLTVWLFNYPYLRFGAEDYNIEDFHNKFSHLTNNSVAKYSDHFSDAKIIGNMWENETFCKFLLEKYGKDVWPEIQQKIKRIVLCSLQSVKHKIAHRKNSHEIFGYDIMVDDQLNCFLIEVNSSPAMDYSTEVTKKLVKIVSEDLIKVVVDYADAPKKEKKYIDTGSFKLIFRGNEVPSSYIPNRRSINEEKKEEKMCKT